MSFVLPALLVLFTMQYVALSLPTSNTASDDIANAVAPEPAFSCNDLHHCRSLAGLLWSCFATIFLCTWVTARPDVCNKWETLFQHKLYKTRMGLMGLMLASPEIVVMHALDQWTAVCCAIARRASNKFTKIQRTEMYGMMERMGGIKTVNKGNSKTNLKLQKTCLTLVTVGVENIGLDCNKCELSTITEDVIKERSEGDAIAKGLMVLQTSWFVTQCAARAAQGLPVTGLELTTLGHITFASIIYFFWWNKPLDVQRPIMLHITKLLDSKSSREGRDSAAGLAVINSHWLIYPNDSVAEMDSESDDLPLVGVKGNYLDFSWRIQLGSYLVSTNIFGRRTFATPLNTMLSITMIFISGIFSMIHCLGWHSHFPSHVKQISWRVSALVVAVLPGFCFTLQTSGVFDTVSCIVTVTIMMLYIWARISLVILAFLALRNLPFAAYQTPSWANLIPHL